MKQMYRKMIVMGIFIPFCLPLYGMDIEQKRRALEEQIRNLTESAKKVVGPIVERVQAEITQLKNQIARLPAEQRPVVTPPPPAPTPRPIEVSVTPSPEIVSVPSVSVQPTTPISTPLIRPTPPATAPEGQPLAERPLPPLPTSEPMTRPTVTQPVTRPLPPVPVAERARATIEERPLPPLPRPEPIILKTPERRPATQVTPAREIRPAVPQTTVEEIRPMTRPAERPLPAVPATRPEGSLPELEPLPAPSEEELSRMVAPVPPMDVPQTRVVEKPSQATLIEEIQKGRRLRPVTPAERREYRSDVYKLFEGEQAARGFERARQQALERAESQTGREEDWQGWE